MKQILLIMTILQLKTLWSSFKRIFSRNKMNTKELLQDLSKLDAEIGDKNVVNVIMMIIMFAYGLFVSTYHIFAGIYVNEIVFISLACIFLIRNIKGMFKAITWIAERKEEIVVNSFKERVFSAIYVAYIVYLIRFLIVNW